MAKIGNISETNKESGKYFTKNLPDSLFEVAWDYQSQSSSSPS